MLQNGIQEESQMQAFRNFQNSKCYTCGYCAEMKMKQEDYENLDVRLSGVIKIWCYAASDVQPINFDSHCFIKEKADNE